MKYFCLIAAVLIAGCASSSVDVVSNDTPEAVMPNTGTMPRTDSGEAAKKSRLQKLSQQVFSETFGSSHDPVSGNTLSVLHYRENFQHRELLKFVTINRTTYNYLTGKELREDETQMLFENGKRMMQKNDFFDSADCIYQYDEHGRLTAVLPNFKYAYPAQYAEHFTEGERIVYLYNNDPYNPQWKYHRTEKIKLLDGEGYAVTILNDAGSEYTTEFIFDEDGFITTLVLLTSLPTRDCYIFEYENDKLSKITYSTLVKNNIEYQFTDIEYDGDAIRTVKFQRRSGDVEHWTLDEYDAYGNWHTAKCLFNGKLSEVITRAIEYVE